MKFENYPKVKDELIEQAIKIIQGNKDKWDSPFFTDTKSYINIEEIQEKTSGVINESLKNVIVLGTGGSIQTLLALKHLSKRNIFPITSSRAVELNRCLSMTTPADSIVIPISRGGETLDINSTIGTFLEKGYKFLGLSSSGTMYKLLEEINCSILSVPDLSGRFAGSISNVGIVPAYISGINVNSFLKGLEDGYRLFMNYDKNIALKFSASLFNLYKKGYKVVFSMPYSENLEGSVGLFVQEISESTGKDGKGLMGSYQAAPLCQHSVLEYLLGGSKGAVMPILWTVNKEEPDLNLESSIEYVKDLSAQSIVNYQADATFQALIEQGVPSAKITIDTPNEWEMGILIAFIQSTIYYLCLLLDVNWATNSKVVIGKQICNEALKNKVPPEDREITREGIADDIFKNFYT